MRMIQIKKTFGAIALGGFLATQVNCLPTHNSLNSAFSSGITNGIEFAITLGINDLLSGLFPANNNSNNGTDTTTTPDTTTTTDTTDTTTTQ